MALGAEKLAAFSGAKHDDKTPAWKMGADAYQARKGVHQPWIAEISPMQYANMGKAAKARYDEKRRGEWDASGAAKGEWAKEVLDAHHRGEISHDTPGLHPEAKDVIRSAKMEAQKQQAATSLGEAQKQNGSAAEEAKVGDKIHHVIYGPATVAKVNKNTLGLTIERNRQPVAITGQRAHAQWMSSDDLHKAVAAGHPIGRDTPYLLKGEKPPAAAPPAAPKVPRKPRAVAALAGAPAVHALQTGAKGGQFYTLPSGHKVYKHGG